MQRCFLRDLSFSKICIELKTLIEQCDEKGKIIVTNDILDCLSLLFISVFILILFIYLYFKDDRPMKIPESKPTAAEHEDNKGKILVTNDSLDCHSLWLSSVFFKTKTKNRFYLV